MGDSIKKPDHYCEGREYEPKDVIRDWGLNFNLGSSVKYISRAGRKGDRLEDLKKARQFLEFEIEAAEKEEYKDNIGMTCKEAAKIGDAMAKGFEDGFAHQVIKGIIHFDSIPDEYKSGVIDRVVEMVRNGEFDLMDIPDDLYDECVRSRSANANREYRKAMDIATKSTEDTITITFNIKED